MKVKICGMKYPDNIAEILALSPDFIGMIFYEKSPRFVGNDVQIPLTKNLGNIGKVGVFVNEEENIIRKIVSFYNLNFVQLHGNESPDFCRKIQKMGVKVIKAFSIQFPSDFTQTEPYEGVCDYFLFDTKTEYYGGSGEKFDWNILSDYKGVTCFILSGGITKEDAQSIKKIQHNKLFAIDINSRFETAPGQKDVNLLRQFLQEIRS